MNLDNRRLREIKELKHNYGILILSAESEDEIEAYYEKINELSNEETQILKRNDVIL